MVVMPMIQFTRRTIRLLLVAAIFVVKLSGVAYWCLRAVRIRMHAVHTYGYVIHEFDPWFNYRAAEYLAEHGYSKFFKWYDYMSWYPIGRPVGTTIYPGMQIASVEIWKVSQMLAPTRIDTPKEYLAYLPKWVTPYFPNRGRYINWGPMSLNDVCCLVPAWFGGVATFLTFMLTWEVSESSMAGLIAAFIMSIIPAHIMRSCAGEFDNEAVAVSAFVLVLWLWARSVRSERSWVFGVPAGFAYAFAAATWGGYIFINNLIGLHAAFLVAIGKYSSSLHKAFTLYYIIGTVGAMQVPVIGKAPLRSLEQMPSLLTFLVYQVIEACDIYRRRRKTPMTGGSFFLFRVGVFTGCAAVVAAVAYVLLQMGVFMPLGARIRGLFLEAVKTGNPLVDSVSEHQPANAQAYMMYLGTPRFWAMAGMLFCWHQKTGGKFLIILYALVAYHYSLKMVRLIIICAPVVSILASYPAGIVIDWCLEQFVGLIYPVSPSESKAPPLRTGGMGSILRTAWGILGPMLYPAEIKDLTEFKESFRRFWIVDRPLRVIIAVALLSGMYQQSRLVAKEFIKHCDEMAVRFANPRLVFKSKMTDGSELIIDDYLRGYEWIRDNTPKDSRVMAWWDYGYQITGVAQRTSIADGNTWNHEHIATLGRIMTSKEAKSHKAMRHLADYVLVWAGGRGDDMGKSPHLARIGNSVFPDHCGDDDPLCTKFSFYRDGSPTPMMAESFLYKAVNHRVKEGVMLNSKYWKEVHQTKYGLLRVYKVLNVSQESKDWVADPNNRVCDAPGSWYCVGQYPPALAPLIAKRRNFKQLEDFNVKARGGEKSAYTKLIEEQRAGKKR